MMLDNLIRQNIIYQRTNQSNDCNINDGILQDRASGLKGIFPISFTKLFTVAC